MDGGPNQADGTESSSTSTTSAPKWTSCARLDCTSEVTSSRGPADRRSFWTILQEIQSSSSSPEADQRLIPSLLPCHPERSEGYALVQIVSRIASARPPPVTLFPLYEADERQRSAGCLT